jgi:MoaA/NifB/PqqE/SkfB family radical SAM enzyme
MNKTFCTYPFDHNYIHPDGKIRLCCTTVQNIPTDDNYTLFDANKHTIDEYWNSNRMKEIRRKMIAGEKIRDCERCYRQEEKGVESLRKTENMQYFIDNTSPDGTYNKPATDMQLQMGNICNLKCKMCSQMYSHMHGMETKAIGEQDPEWLHWVKTESANVNNWTNDLGTRHEWYKNVEFKTKTFEHISKNIQHLTIIGGEPTLIPEFYEMFEYLEEQGTLRDKSIRITTNLTTTNPKLTRWLPKLKDWNLFASIDGIAERTEYIRYPSDWNKILTNLQFYKDLLGDNGGLTLSPAVQLLNIDQLDEIVKFWKDFSQQDRFKRAYKYNWSWAAVVWYPLICNPSIAPRGWRLKVADKLSEYKFDEEYDSLIGELRKDQHSEEQAKQLQRSFIKYNDRQDQFRKVPHTWRQLLPDLEEAIENNLKD